MAANKPVWGIDLGQSALKAIRLRVAGDKVEAIDHFYLEYSKILSQPDADRQALVTEAMKKFTADHDLTKETLVVAVPGQHTLARFTKLPPVTKKKIPEIVKYEAQQQIPFDMEEVIWDYQVFEDAGATETQVGIFAMRRELLRAHLFFLSSLNLEPALVQSAPLALYNALKYDGVCGTEPICILDIGAQNTDLLVVDGDSLWTRNIPIGGNNFTEALLKTFKLSFNKAENLKRTAASSKYARQIFQAMRPVFADLVAEVQRSIGFFTSSRRGVKLNKVIAMGNAFKLPGMLKFVQQNLGMEVIRPSTFNKLSASGATNAPELIDQLLSYGVAYGLALQGLGKGQITSNLLPPEIAKQVIWRKKIPWFYGSAACLLLSAGLVWGRNYVDQGVVTKSRGESRGINFPLEYAKEDVAQKNPLPSPAALKIIDTGSTETSPLQKAAQVSAVGQHLGQVLSQVEGLNQTEISEAQELATLQSHKVVWPRILDLIHEALPKGDPALSQALKEGPDAFKALIQSKPEKYGRSKREQIYIEKFVSEFSSDVNSTYKTKKLATGRSVVASPTDAASMEPAKLGFVITIRARTPNAGSVTFVNEKFLANLRKATSKGVYIDKVGPPLWWEQTKEWKPSGSMPGARPGRSPAGTSMRPLSEEGAGETSRGPAVEADKDPVTGEAVNDTLFEIVFVAVIGDRPAETPATPGGVTPAGGAPVDSN